MIMFVAFFFIYENAAQNEIIGNNSSQNPKAS